MVRLREYYQDPSTPAAHDVLPAAFAAVRSSAGELLLVRRIDDGNWELAPTPFSTHRSEEWMT